MKQAVNIIPLINLVMVLIPVALVFAIIVKWKLKVSNAVYAILRMLTQLVLIGYVLAFIFESDKSWIVLIVLTIMLLFAGWIALRTQKEKRLSYYKYALASLVIGGGTTLFIVTQLVLDLTPWYMPRYMVPIAGMVFANSMNSISLAAERFNAEISRGESFVNARNIAFQASLIPVVNSLFAVGIVSLPGMMTGQILSGVSPFIAARYQIMVMCMIFGAAGISSASYLMFIKKHYID